MKILVTGKNGYIGSSLISKLDYEITSIGREDFDLTDREATNNWFKNKYFDVIIHTAISGGSRLKKDGDEVLAKNLKMFYNLMANVSKFKQLISLGSGAELNLPSNPYGLSKAIISDIISSHSKLNNIRIYGVFDENEWNTRFIKTCLRKYKNKEPITIHQNKLFDFIYMDDLVTTIKFIILNPNIKVIDACYKEKYTLREIAEYITTIGDYNCVIEVEDKELGNPYMGHFKDYNLNLIGLKQGINKVYDTTN
jgi:UDP-glucose 4-epimerase